MFQNEYQVLENEYKLGFVSVLNDKGEIKKGELLSDRIFLRRFTLSRIFVYSFYEVFETIPKKKHLLFTNCSLK